MQHPDEGTIHSWLDGALPAAEAASVESHVATCEPCAAAVAEARGFIAASSRILTALDDVPRGVLPAVPERKRDLRVFWRAAAAMLVVAGGSLVVMREGGPDARLTGSSKRAIPVSATTAAPRGAETAPSVVGTGSSVVQVDETAATGRPAPSEAAARRSKPEVPAERDLAANARRRDVMTPAGALGSGITNDAAAVTSAAAPTRTPGPPTAPPPMAATATLLEGEVPLKVLGVAQRAGSRQTTYEIAPGQTVTLTEREPAVLSRAGVTSAQSAAAPMVLREGRAAQPSRAEAAPATPPPPPATDSRTATDSAVDGRVAGVAKAPVAQSKAPTFSDALQTITWTEVRTGKTLTLTGNLSVERLQEIRRRIEKERAAAGVTP